MKIASRPLIIPFLILFTFNIATILLAEENEGIISLDKQEEQIRQLDQRELDALYLDAILSDKLGEEEEADLTYNKILNHCNLILDNPRSTKKQKLNALKQIARIKTRQNEFEDVIQLCCNLRDDYPNEPAISIIEAETRQFYAAHYCSQGGLTELSIEEFKAILELDNLPEEWYAFAKDYIAHLYILKQDPEEALYWYNRIISDHPNLKNWPASAHFSIASYYLRQNLETLAREELNIIIQQHPESAWARPALDKLKSLE